MKSNNFKSPYEWSTFCQYLINENRYVLDKKWREFISSILKTAKKRKHILKAKTILVRARIGSIWEELENEDGSIRIEH